MQHILLLKCSSLGELQDITGDLKVLLQFLWPKPALVRAASARLLAHLQKAGTCKHPGSCVAAHTPGQFPGQPLCAVLLKGSVPMGSQDNPSPPHSCGHKWKKLKGTQQICPSFCLVFWLPEMSWVCLSVRVPPASLQTVNVSLASVSCFKQSHRRCQGGITQLGTSVLSGKLSEGFSVHWHCDEINHP